MLKRIGSQVNILSLTVQIESSRIDGAEGRAVDAIGKQMSELSTQSEVITREINAITKRLQTAMATVKEIVGRQIEIIQK
jgi:cytochrome c556